MGGAGRLIISAVLFSAAAGAETFTTPKAISPFPGGLSGTLVFQSDARGPDNPDGRTHLFTIDLATGAIAQLTSGRDHRDENPRWSSDGRRIAFKSTRGG